MPGEGTGEGNKSKHKGQRTGGKDNDNNGLSVGPFGMMGRLTEGPNNDHDDIHHRDGQNEEGDDPFANTDWFIFLSGHQRDCGRRRGMKAGSN